MDKRFPKFKSHEAVKCFKCEGGVSPAQPSGLPSGAWQARCAKCRLFTFYDVRKAA